jgi:GNAT superfamily N-acetyltransferase
VSRSIRTLVRECGQGDVMYRIREIDATDEDVADALADLHRATFLNSAPVPSFDEGHWWMAYHDGGPVAFAGVIPSTHFANAGYFCRVGVLREHRGHRLQLRLMRAMEGRARLNGWCSIVSDTTENVRSANNLIHAGYRLFMPACPWGWANTLYWRKDTAATSRPCGTPAVGR